MVVVGFVVALVTCQTPAPKGLDTPITYDQTAKAVPAVLAELTKQSKVQLTANPEAAKEILLITVKDLPLKSLMNKIAFVTSCEWQSEGAGYTLPKEILGRPTGIFLIQKTSHAAALVLTMSG